MKTELGQEIDKLWENAGHGTEREDIKAAFMAGVIYCLKIADDVRSGAIRVAHPDAEVWATECVDRIKEIEKTIHLI